MQRDVSGGARLEALVLGAVFIIVSFLIARADAFEFLSAWLSGHEKWQLDEWVLVLTFLVLCVGCFSVLRLRESKREMARREAAEAQLLEINRELEATVQRRTASLQSANDELAKEIAERKAAGEQRDAVLKDLQHALTSVRQLSGILPICSSCKKIRDDSGYWRQVEAYIREHSEAEFSHSLCPECLEKLYPDVGKSPAKH